MLEEEQARKQVEGCTSRRKREEMERLEVFKTVFQKDGLVVVGDGDPDIGGYEEGVGKECCIRLMPYSIKPYSELRVYNLMVKGISRSWSSGRMGD